MSKACDAHLISVNPTPSPPKTDEHITISVSLELEITFDIQFVTILSIFTSTPHIQWSLESSIQTYTTTIFFPHESILQNVTYTQRMTLIHEEYLLMSLKQQTLKCHLLYRLHCIFAVYSSKYDKLSINYKKNKKYQ